MGMPTYCIFNIISIDSTIKYQDSLSEMTYCGTSELDHYQGTRQGPDMTLLLIRQHFP